MLFRDCSGSRSCLMLFDLQRSRAGELLSGWLSFCLTSGQGLQRVVFFLQQDWQYRCARVSSTLEHKTLEHETLEHKKRMFNKA
ncbi:uncharacterized protein LOC119173582 isoform X3 [Rhipicephalus microplus]|uniref:uncharacterized protein LOC119173582 isoform X3 n=1 Tax=Rhipicephalus microplus TaxID=6941 RepID=UPI003F6AA22E